MKTSELLQTYIYPNLNIQSLLQEIYIKEMRGSYSLICPSCGKKEAYIIKKHGSIVPYIYCNRLNKCAYSISLWDYIKNRGGISNRDTLYYLASNANIDIKDFNYSGDSHTKRKNISNIEIRLIQKPLKLYELERYFKLHLLIKDFENLPEKLQFCTIATFIYMFSLNKSSFLKDEYYKSRGIYNTKELGSLNFSDMKELEQKLLKNFDIKSLQKFNIFKNDKFKYSFSSFSVVPSFDLYSNLITAIRLRNLRQSKIKEIELSASRIANPLPFGLTRDKLLKYDVFYFTEGHIDALSLNIENFVAVEGVNSFHKKFFGLFKGKRIIFIFDQDKAGVEGAKKLAFFADKLHIENSIISWDKKHGNDINELLVRRKI